METTLHEVAHAFAFSSNLFGYFRSTDGKVSMNTDYTPKNVIVDVSYRNEVGNILNTPFVRKWAAEHFGCSRINDSNETEDVFKGM